MPPSLKSLVNPKIILGILPAPKNRTSGIATSPELPGVRHNCDASDDTISLPYCKTSLRLKLKILMWTRKIFSSFNVCYNFFMLPAICHPSSICILFLYYFPAGLSLLIITWYNWMKCCFSEADIFVTFALLLLPHIERGKRMTMEELESK